MELKKHMYFYPPKGSPPVLISCIVLPKVGKWEFLNFKIKNNA
jgi:hypothetical protein